MSAKKKTEPKEIKPFVALLVYAGVGIGARGTQLHVYHELAVRRNLKKGIDVDEWLADGHVRQLIQEVEGHERLNEGVGWKKVIGHTRQVGAILTVECEDKSASTIYAGTGTRVGEVDDQVAAEWQAASSGCEVELQVERDRRKEKSVDHLAEQLAPVREAYKRLRTKAQRAAMLAAVIETVTRGS